MNLSLDTRLDEKRPGLSRQGDAENATGEYEVMNPDRKEAGLDLAELDLMPELIILELSARKICPYALYLRRKFKDALNQLKQQKAKVEVLENSLLKARMACKRLKESNQITQLEKR